MEGILITEDRNGRLYSGDRGGESAGWKAVEGLGHEWPGLYGVSGDWRTFCAGLVGPIIPLACQQSSIDMVCSVGAPPAMDQHETTRAVVSAVPIADVRWSLICVAMMYPSDPQQGLFEPLQGPKHHNLLVQADVAAAWEHSWVENIPCIGRTIWLWVSQVWRYTAKYEYVADMLAEDLEKEDSQWLGKKVGYIEKEKIKSV